MEHVKSDKKPKRLLIIDDEQGVLDSLDQYFSATGYHVELADSGESAILSLQNKAFDVVVTDVAMPGMDGLAVLQWLQHNRPDTPCIMITGVGTIDHAVEAMRSGAFHYLSKPFGPAELELQIDQAIEHSEFRKGLGLSQTDGELGEMIIGEHPLFLKLIQTLEQVANSTAPVMISGEPGTGRSILARRIHELSPRGDKLFLSIDCGALPAALLQRELFGYEQGAFVGANTNKLGLIETCAGGTLFLDEVDGMPLQTQSLLAAAIQEGAFKPLGGARSKPINARFVSASSRDPQQAITSGAFREELYYCLAAVHLKAPALRERCCDILPLAQHFIRTFNVRYKKGVKSLAPQAMIQLKSNEWTGNVRELKNVIERAVLLSRGDCVTSLDLPVAACAIPQSVEDNVDGEGSLLRQHLQDAKFQAVIQALTVANGNKSKAARLLGVTRQTIHKKIREFDIDVDHLDTY